MMNENLWPLVLVFTAGSLLGIFFFGGLQWTLKKYLTSAHGWFFITASMIVRLVVTVIGFYYLGQGQWQRILICLSGFLVTRSVFIHWTRPKKQGSL